jgi:tetratricopeptide (TPR) repeat protein
LEQFLMCAELSHLLCEVARSGQPDEFDTPAWFQQVCGEALLAADYVSGGSYEHAAECFNNVLQVDQSFFPAQTELVKICIEKKEAGDARGRCDWLRSTAPSHQFVTNVCHEVYRSCVLRDRTVERRALEALMKGDYANARLAVADVEPRDPRAPICLAVHGFVLFEEGNFPAARQIITELIALGEATFDCAVLLGRIELALGNLAQALDALTIEIGAGENSVTVEEAVKLRPPPFSYASKGGLLIAYAARALVFESIGLRDRAFKEAKLVSARANGVGAALMYCARVFQAHKRHRLAQRAEARAKHNTFVPSLIRHFEATVTTNLPSDRGRDRESSIDELGSRAWP